MVSSFTFLLRLRSAALFESSHPPNSSTPTTTSVLLRVFSIRSSRMDTTRRRSLFNDSSGLWSDVRITAPRGWWRIADGLAITLCAHAQFGSSSRSDIRSGVLNRRSLAVARASGDCGTMNGPRLLKWAFHFSVRGLNKAVNSPVSGSSEAMSEPLNKLHMMQEAARFSRVVAPPCFSAMMWST